MNRRQKVRDAETRHLEMVSRGLIADRYPEVKSIQIKKKFKDFDTDKEFTKENKVWNPPATAYAYFNIDCPMYECVNGGFDLTSLIDEMIKKRAVSKKGTVACQGWQDRERVGKHRCLTELIYEVSVKYKT